MLTLMAALEIFTTISPFRTHQARHTSCDRHGSNMRCWLLRTSVIDFLRDRQTHINSNPVNTRANCSSLIISFFKATTKLMTESFFGPANAVASTLGSRIAVIHRHPLGAVFQYVFSFSHSILPPYTI